MHCAESLKLCAESLKLQCSASLRYLLSRYVLSPVSLVPSLLVSKNVQKFHPSWITPCKLVYYVWNVNIDISVKDVEVKGMLIDHFPL